MRSEIRLVTWAVALAGLFGPSCAFAQSATVTKVKGRQAVVQFPEGHVPEVGDSIDLSPRRGGGGGGKAGGSRNYTLGFSGSFSILSNSQTSKNTIALSLEGRFGWNFSEYEAGPIGVFKYSTADDRSSRTFGGGGFFDFNFIPNNGSEELIYGAGAEGTFGQTSVSTTSVENSSTEMTIFAGMFAKWFALGNFALRGDGGYAYVRSNTNNGTTVSTSGLLVKAGLQVYF